MLFQHINEATNPQSCFRPTVGEMMMKDASLLYKILLLMSLFEYFPIGDARPNMGPPSYPTIRFQNWMEHESHCGGQHQSPINIEMNEAIIVDNYPEFIFHNYDLVFSERLKNNGHTVEMKIEDGSNAELPFITGGGLSDRYNFVQLHFHWGESYYGSEHRINGEQYPAELHIVHYNSKYGSFNEALSHVDGLAVFGILIELQPRDNIAFRHLGQFDNIINPSTTNSDELRYSVPLADLLPDHTDSFFRYNGSLTSGDCNEDVIWTIFDTPIAISERQLAKFRLLRDENGNELIENVRSTQLLHDRVVMYRPYSNPPSPLLSAPLNSDSSFSPVLFPFN